MTDRIRITHTRNSEKGTRMPADTLEGIWDTMPHFNVGEKVNEMIAEVQDTSDQKKWQKSVHAIISFVGSGFEFDPAAVKKLLDAVMRSKPEVVQTFLRYIRDLVKKVPYEMSKLGNGFDQTPENMYVGYLSRLVQILVTIECDYSKEVSGQRMGAEWEGLMHTADAALAGLIRSLYVPYKFREVIPYPHSLLVVSKAFIAYAHAAKVAPRLHLDDNLHDFRRMSNIKEVYEQVANFHTVHHAHFAEALVYGARLLLAINPEKFLEQTIHQRPWNSLLRIKERTIRNVCEQMSIDREDASMAFVGSILAIRRAVLGTKKPKEVEMRLPQSLTF